jgi:hypothetical protein
MKSPYTKTFSIKSIAVKMSIIVFPSAIYCSFLTIYLISPKATSLIGLISTQLTCSGTSSVKPCTTSTAIGFLTFCYSTRFRTQTLFLCGSTIIFLSLTSSINSPLSVI